MTLPSWNDLKDRLQATRAKAIVPISDFPVGALALGTSGRLYEGYNMEWKGVPLCLTVHAEASSVVRAWQAGETELRALYVTETPCGHCRQFLWELTCRQELLVLLPDSVPLSLTDLLPRPFDLNGRGFLGHASRRLPSESDDDELTAAARRAAEISYCPYSGVASGLALRGANGTIWTGGCVENAAYNPGLTALQTALIARGRTDEPVESAALVETRGSISAEALFEEPLTFLWPEISLRYLRA